MSVQQCTLVDVRDPGDNARFVFVTPQTPFVDNDDVGHSAQVKFDYVSNALPSTAKVPRSDATGNSPTPVLYTIRRVLGAGGAGSQTWTNVLLDADTVSLDSLAQVPNSPVVTVAIVTQVDGHTPDAEGHVTTGLPAEITRATAAEAANATAISSETTRATAAEATKAPLPTGSPAVGKVPTVTGISPLALDWETPAAGGGAGVIDNNDGTWSTTTSALLDNSNGTWTAS